MRRDLIGLALGLFGGLCVGIAAVFGSDPQTALVAGGPVVPIIGMALLRAAAMAGRRRARGRSSAAAPRLLHDDTTPSLAQSERRAA